MAGIDNNTLLYLRGDSFIDLSLNNHTITNSNNILNITGGIYGNCIDLTSEGKKLLVDGLKLPRNTFTIDWWELNKGATGSGATALVTDLRTADTAIKSLILGKASTKSAPIIFSSATNTSSWEISEHTIGSTNTTDWIHRALVFDGINFISYENGVKYTSIATNGGISDPGTNIQIGALRENTTCYNAHVAGLRISNIVRYTENFEPPTRPYTSVSLNIISQNNNEVNFFITKGSVNESISKVDILVNGNVIQTFNEGYENINYTIDKAACWSGDNDVEIRAYYYNNFYESSSFVYNNIIEKLPEQPTLPEINDKLNEIKNSYSVMNDRLYNILLNEGCELTVNDKHMNTLVRKVEEYTNIVKEEFEDIKEKLISTLSEKNIDCSTSNSIEELIAMVDEIRSSPFADWAKANTWLVTGTCTAMPATSYLLTAQAYKNKIYCIGGSGTTTANRAYNVKTNTWETLANMTTGRYGLDSTIIGDKIYCIGGYNNLTANQVYDITNNSWSTLTNMTTGREYLTVDAVGTNIYAIGGSGSTTYLNNNECYDTITNTWSTKTAMTVAKYGHASGVIGTDVYCIGGYTGSYVKTNYCYDTITNTWTTKTALTAVRSDGDCVEANGKLYFIFGRSAASTYQRNNYCYDPTTNTWTTMTTSTGVTSYGRALAYTNGMIFAFGGYNGSALSAVECYII